MKMFKTISPAQSFHFDMFDLIFRIKRSTVSYQIPNVFKRTEKMQIQSVKNDNKWFAGDRERYLFVWF